MINAKFGVFVIGAMIAVGAITYNQLKDQALENEATFIVVYLTWLSFALSLNLYIASKCYK